MISNYVATLIFLLIISSQSFAEELTDKKVVVKTDTGVASTTIDVKVERHAADNFERKIQEMSAAIEQCYGHISALNPLINKTMQLDVSSGCHTIVLVDYAGRIYTCRMTPDERSAFAMNFKSSITDNTSFGDILSSSINLLHNSCEIE